MVEESSLTLDPKGRALLCGKVFAIVGHASATLAGVYVCVFLLSSLH